MIERRHHNEPFHVERRKRGRPKSDAPLVEMIYIRVTAAQHRRLVEIASINSLNASAFVRQALNDAALDCTDEPIFSD